MADKPLVRLLGVPFDYGSDRRGVDMGPSALRCTDLIQRLERLGYPVQDGGNVPVPVPHACRDGASGLAYLPHIERVVRHIADMVTGSLQSGELPLLLGGDHALSLGTAMGLGAWCQRTGATAGLLWFDAHPDYNTAATSPSGNIHGMCLAALVGDGEPRLTRLWQDVPFVPPQRVAVIGLRSVDEGERERLLNSGIHLFTMSDIDRGGMAQVAERALKAVGDGVDHLYVSIDLDVMDPHHAPGVGTPVAGGLTYREAQLAMEMLAATDRITGVEVVELNPILDRSNQTAELAAELVLSLLGKRIL